MFTEIPISINPYDMPQKIDYPNVHTREPFCDDNLLEHNIYSVYQGRICLESQTAVSVRQF